MSQHTQHGKHGVCKGVGSLLVAVFVIAMIVIAIVDSGGDSEDKADTAAASKTADKKPSSDKTTPKTPKQKIQAAIDGMDSGKTKAKISKGSVQVELNLKTGWSTSSMSTAARHDTIDLLQAVKRSGSKADVYLEVNAPAQTKEGNETTMLAANLGYTTKEIHKINYENVHSDDIWDLATGPVLVNQDFKK